MKCSQHAYIPYFLFARTRQWESVIPFGSSSLKYVQAVIFELNAIATLPSSV